MLLSDLPLSFLFLFFLLIFVLIGLYPAWQRTAAKIRKHLQASGKPQEPLPEPFKSEQTAIFSGQQTTLALNDFEIFVLKRLAQNGGKALSRKQINADLHLEPAILSTTLESLRRRRLIQIAMTPLLGIRFYLSENGRDYAIEQGFIPGTRGRNERF